ncbi:uncharacterized protein E0L32_010221 [Thyridium curvatum]|uniref:cAMP-independent regulatory protein pac2 n=1 Tax=Thyridium curvatum TaxID=1093900 RepID=A0A507ANZ5_9PEZI|nr:uncharacterized protein E0L32_010221 [Thyridium curvatum]TPX08154.1 hypothetical protein E0L32_010221 [Thyridium curvatum]
MMETYHGYVRTPGDAIKLFEACRQGLLPRVQRRLSEKERQSIRSGSVFVWDEREAGMRRWTDGKSWSASRVSGSFLTYREMEGKRGGGFGNSRRGAGKTPDSSGRASDDDQDDGEPDGYRYKADGLMKQSFSITTSQGQHLHLISYYSRPHPGQPELLQPSNDPQLRNVIPMKGLYPESSLAETPVPAMTRTPMQQPPYLAPQQHGHPPHGAPYPPYPQQGYGWPPSPMATPPYGHYPHHYPPNGPPPPPGAHYPSQPAYAGAPPPNPQYDRAPLPLPTSAPQSRTTPPTLAPYNPAPHHYQHSPHLPQPRPSDSPRLHQLQSQAQQASLDPRLAPAGAKNAPGPLPAISANGTMSTPPPRGSASPPRSSHSDSNGGPPSGNKASLSILLHPTPTNSEPTSANPASNSAGNSPRQLGVASSAAASASSVMGSKILPPPSSFHEDARALSVLDRKFLHTRS